MVGTPLMARQLAVELYIDNKKKMGPTVEALAAKWGEGWGKPPRRLDKFVLRHANKWDKTGDLHDGRRTGCTPKLKKADVDKAAVLFGAGYDEVAVVVKGERAVIQHHGFKSMNEALIMCPALEALRVSCGVSAQTLFRRIKKAHKDIRRMSRDYKRAESMRRKSARKLQRRGLRSMTGRGRRFWSALSRSTRGASTSSTPASTGAMSTGSTPTRG